MPNKPITIQNQTFSSIKEACAHFGVNERTVHARRLRGWDIDDQFVHPDEPRKCKVCGEILTNENQWRDEMACIPCGKKIKSEREKRYRPKRIPGERKWRAENPDKLAQYRKNEKYKRSHYIRKYGITKDQVDELLSKGCECCGSTDKLVIDHNHTTQDVRGCLCHGCNVSLGFALDSSEKLRKLADYIDRTSINPAIKKS